MKKVLLASTALVLSAGFAAAEVTVGGDGRMGIKDNFDLSDFYDTYTTADGSVLTGDDVPSNDLGFSSRIRISFAASGETDAGLQFGGSTRVDHASGMTSGTAGSVFVAGSFGKLSMGDVDGAARTAVGHVSGVGYTALSDFNEIFYVANAGDDPSALYEYSSGNFGFYLSSGNPSSDADAYAVGVNFSTGDFTFALGYEDADVAALSFDDADIDVFLDVPADQIIAGVTAGLGDLTAKAVYATGEADGNDLDQYAVSLDFTTGATTFTGYYRSTDYDGTELTAYGIGATYDLGGGAAIEGGWVNVDIDDLGSSDAYDLGLTFSF
jgi:outer membrane protein OmpU